MSANAIQAKTLMSVNRFETEAEAKVFADAAERMLHDNLVVLAVPYEADGTWLVYQRIVYLSREGEASGAVS